MVTTTNRINSLSLILPAYNEENNLRKVVEQALSVLGELIDDYEIIIVNDGSYDRTGEIAEDLARKNPHIRIFHHPYNQGYGATLRDGILQARKEWIFICDADQQFDLREINKFLPLAGNYDFVIGYRIRRRDPVYRRILALVYRYFLLLLFGLKVRDVDCAFKLMRRHILQNSTLMSGGAFVSAELLLRSREKGAKIKQIGIHHYPRLTGKSHGANWKVVMQTFREMYKFKIQKFPSGK